jgi:hypothetical protein
LGRSIELASELIDRREALLGRPTEPIPKVVPHLIVLIHPMYMHDLAIHTVIISP